MKIFITSVVDLKKTPHNRLHQLIRHLSKKHDVTVMCINDCWKAGQTDARRYVEGIEKDMNGVNIIYLTNKKIPPYFQEALSFLKVFRLDGMASYDVHLNYNTLVSGYFVSKRVRHTVYDIADDLPVMIRNSPQIPSVLRPLGAMLGRYMFNANISSSEKVTFITRSIEKDYSLEAGRSVLIPNGVDSSHFKPSGNGKEKAAMGLGDDFVVGYVGVLREWVDIDTVLKAAVSLDKAGIRVKLLIVGEEGGLVEARRLAERYGIADRVVFTGTVSYNDVPRYIACMDVCVIPFKNESVSMNSLPLKLFEYMACEKPVISTPIKGVVEAVGDRVMYASDAAGFHEAVLRVYKDRRLGETLGAEGRKYVMEHHDWGSISSRFEQVLAEAAR